MKRIIVDTPDWLQKRSTFFLERKVLKEDTVNRSKFLAFGVEHSVVVKDISLRISFLIAPVNHLVLKIH